MTASSAPEPGGQPASTVHEGDALELDRLALLSEASELLSSALEPGEMLQRLGALVVPRLADWYTVEVLEPPPSAPEAGVETTEASPALVRRRVALAHVDPAKVAWAWELDRRYPARDDAPAGVPNVLRTGQSELYRSVPDELLARNARDEEHLGLLREVGFSSLIIVPLRSSGETVGAMALVSAESGRTYGPAELALAELLGRLAGVALTNARHLAEIQRDRERLKRKRERLDDLVRAVPGVVWEAWGEPDQASQRIDFVSGHVTQMLGYSPSEWLSTPNFWLTIVHPDDREAAAAVARAKFQGAPHGTNEFRWLTKDGRVLWVQAESTVIRDAAGRAIGMRGVTFDITPRKQAELVKVALEEERAALIGVLAESEARFRTLAESLPQLVWSSRADGTPDYFNQHWCTYTGLPPSTGYDYDLTAFVHPDDRPRNGALWDEARAAGRTHENEIRLRRHDGTYRWFLMRVTPRRDERGVAVQWFGTCTDIEEQKATAARMSSLVAEQRRSFEEAERARRDAEEANRTKDEFLAVVSHELRTPLNAILGWSQLLSSGSLDETQARKAAATIERNARAQAKLVDDILDVSRIITGKLRLAAVPLRLATAIEAALEVVRPAAESKDITVAVSLAQDGGAIVGDTDRLQQIVWNLLANAVKFTPRGGLIEVRHWQTTSEACMSVTDNGQGIGADFLPYLFDRFRQASAGTTRAHGGLGLGLAIVKQLVELHGGTVEATSKGAGQGATFTLRFPLASSRESKPWLVVPRASSPPPGEPGPQPSRHQRLMSLTVVIVDDEPDARELLASLLEREGAQVLPAEDAASALSLVRTHRPDALVSDVGMPGEDGYGLLRLLRALPSTEGGRTPAVALTAFARTEDRARALQAGFDVHVAKPVDVDELIAAVRCAVERGEPPSSERSAPRARAGRT